MEISTVFFRGLDCWILSAISSFSFSIFVIFEGYRIIEEKFCVFPQKVWWVRVFIGNISSDFSELCEKIIFLLDFEIFSRYGLNSSKCELAFLFLGKSWKVCSNFMGGRFCWFFFF